MSTQSVKVFPMYLVQLSGVSSVRTGVRYVWVNRASGPEARVPVSSVPTNATAFDYAKLAEGATK